MAHEYRYTFDDFLDLTLRQVHFLLKIIAKRKLTDHYNAMSIQAAFHRVELPPLEELTSGKPASRFEPEDDLKLERAAFDTMKRKREEAEAKIRAQQIS